MKEQTAKEKFKQRDRSLRSLAVNDTIRIAIAKTTKMTQDATKRHSLDPISSILLARVLTASTLMATFLKGEERITVEVLGSGAVRRIYAESIQVGETRGFIDSQFDEEIEENISIPSLLGAGLLRVSRIVYGKFEPVVGIVDLQYGDITSDIAYYFHQSEQVPSAVILDVAVNEKGEIEQSGGIIVQAMPGATEVEVQKIHDFLLTMEPLTAQFERGITVEEVFESIKERWNDAHVLTQTPVDFFCRCSMDKFKSMLLTLETKEIRSMQEDGHNELKCQYCSATYNLTESDFDELITKMQARSN